MNSEKVAEPYLVGFKIKFIVAVILYAVMTLAGATAITAGMSEKIVLPCVALLSFVLPIAALSLLSFKGRGMSSPFGNDTSRGSATFGVMLEASASFILGVIVTTAATAARGIDPQASPQISLTRLYWPGQPSEKNEMVALQLLGEANQKKNEGSCREAIEKYKDYLRHVPDDSYAISDRGACYKELGDLEKAMEDYRQAYSIEKKKNASLSPKVYELYYAQKSVSDRLQSRRRTADRYGEPGG